MRTDGWRQLLVWSAVWLGAVGCLEDFTDSAPCLPGQGRSAPEVIVGRDGGRFVAEEGRAAAFGGNAYFLLESMRRGRVEEVEGTLELMAGLGMEVVRVWAFDNGGRRALHRGPGELDEEGLEALDEVIAMASARGLRVLLVLGNYWPDYGGLPAYGEWAGVQGDAAIWGSAQVRAAYGEWVRAVVGRTNTVTGWPYATDPAIFGWEVTNEPRCVGAGCSPELVAGFMGAMVSEVRRLDAVHLVGVGDEGFFGRYGVDAGLLVAGGEFDWVSLHLYPNRHEPLWGPDGGGAWVPTRAMAEAEERIDRSVELARRWDLPVLIGELGWPSDGGDDERAAMLGGMLAHARARGVGGALVWMVAAEAYPDYDGYTLHARAAPHTIELLCRASAVFGMPVEP